MQEGDLPGEIEAKACPMRERLQAVEGLKDVRVLLLGNAGTLIADFDAAFIVGRDRDRARAATVIYRVANEVCQALDLQRVHLDMGLAGRGLEGAIPPGSPLSQVLDRCGLPSFESVDLTTNKYMIGLRASLGTGTLFDEDRNGATMDTYRPNFVLPLPLIAE